MIVEKSILTTNLRNLKFCVSDVQHSAHKLQINDVLNVKLSYSKILMKNYGLKKLTNIAKELSEMVDYPKSFYKKTYFYTAITLNWVRISN